MTALTWRSTLPWRRLAGQAAAWWLSELSGLLPVAVRSRLAGRSTKTLRLDFTRDGASLLVPGRDRSIPVLVPVATDAAARASFDWTRLAGLPVQIRLAEGFLFRPVVDLPLAAERSLGPILRHQLERLVPLDPATLCFAWSVIERTPAKNRLKVEICIVKQTTIERATALVRELGLTPQMVFVEGGRHPPAVLWRAPAARQVSPRERMIRHGLELATICFALAAYGIFVWHLNTRRAALRDLVTDLQTRTQTVQALSARASTAERTLAEVNTRLTAPSPLALLDALTRAIPLDSSVSEFHLQGGTIEISGIASHATTLLAVIEREHLFEGASFLAPIIAAGQDAGERYQLGFRVKGSVTP